MSNTFLQLQKAKLEIIEAWEWYEEKQTGLGDDFKHAVEQKIKFILQNPLLYPPKGKYREAQTDGFPYLIIFKYLKDKKLILITSVFHMKRHPKRK